MDQFKIRCSAIGQIMTNPRNKSELISETAKAHVIEWHVSRKYGRKKDITNQFIRKGLMVEEDAITLLSLTDGKMYLKNEMHFHDADITGTPDIINGTEIIDVKSSWDLWTFTKSRTNEIADAYWWQMQGYMALTGATSARVVHCLVDTPPQMIEDAKRKLAWAIGTDSPYLSEALEALEREMTFGDIPESERIYSFTVCRDDESIEKIRERVALCREYILTRF